jgi:hypothetical protein
MTLYHAKSNDTATLDPISLALDWDAGRIVFRSTELQSDEGPSVPGDSTAAAILELMEDGEIFPISAICSALETPDRKKETIRRVVYRLRGRGLLVETDAGLRIAR